MGSMASNRTLRLYRRVLMSSSSSLSVGCQRESLSLPLSSVSLSFSLPGKLATLWINSATWVCEDDECIQQLCFLLCVTISVRLRAASPMRESEAN
uniref:Uncharacterized protein n=1 Tax=Plectus sambesii TaxID=2011161 RepID=A0A914V3H2_9BILA